VYKGKHDKKVRASAEMFFTERILVRVVYLPFGGISSGKKKIGRWSKKRERRGGGKREREREKVRKGNQLGYTT